MTINIQNNLFLSSTEKTASFIAFGDTTQSNEMLKMNISGNRFVGVAGIIDNPSNNSVLDLSGNYYNVYSDSFMTAAGRKILGGAIPSTAGNIKTMRLQSARTDWQAISSRIKFR